MNKHFLIIVLLFSTAILFAQNNKISLKIGKIEILEGSIMIAGFDNKSDFKSKDNPIFTESIKVTDSILIITIPDVPNGQYAIAIYHDQNSDNELNTSKLGIPNEGFGFSNDLNSIFRKPKFEDFKFELKNDTLIPINMHYW